MLQRLRDFTSNEAGRGEADAPAPFAVTNLTAAYRGDPVVFAVDFSPPEGSLSAIIGPNGAGKSTFLKAALGLIPRLSGQTLIYGKPLSANRREIAYVPQRASVDWDFPASVMDVTMMGLQAEIGWLRWPGPRHYERARAALADVGMEDFASRQIGQLSGGQRQRVFLSRALVQDANVLVLDEPFAGVDAATEAAIVGVFRTLKAHGRTVICVHHDLSTVPDYFDYALLMNIAKIAEGPVAKSFTPENLSKAYGGRLPLNASPQAAL